MILCIDIGNTHIFCGIFKKDELLLKFRHPTQTDSSSDQIGIFLKNALKENSLDPNAIENIIISSVVPSIDYSMKAACVKYFNIMPMELKPGIKTGLKLNVKNPLEVGADRIANAVAAIHYFNDKDIIVVDLGTATTACCISKEKEFLGGVILPGYKTSMQALHQNTAKLAPVNIIKPRSPLGKTTEENIQSGLYYCQLGAIKEITHQFITTTFHHSKDVVILGTGGYAYLFEQEKLFDKIVTDLTLHGLLVILNRNI